MKKVALEVLKFPLTKEMLDRAPAAERTLYLQLGLLANEINLLQRDLLVSSKSIEGSELERDAAAAQILLTARTMAGRLYEAWLLLKTNAAVRLPYESSAQFKTAWQELGSYFGKKNLIELVRNKVAFHNDAKLAAEAYEYLQDMEFHEYVTSHRGGCLFGSAQAILAIAICRLTGEDDYEVALGRLMDELIDCSARFADLIHAFLPEFWGRHLEEGVNLVGEKIVIDDPPTLADASLPFFYTPIDPETTS